MRSADTWQEYLEEHFPGFLLPHTERCRLTRAAAETFLERLGLGARNLPLLRGMGLLAAHDDVLHEFASYWLPELVRVLPSHTSVQQRAWRGGFQGRLDVPATLQHHLGGDRSVFVTRARRRRWDLPENVLVRGLVARTERLLERLQAAGMLHGKGWTERAVGALASLRAAVRSPLLRELSEQPIEAYHVRAARNARHPAYASAVRWYERLVAVMDTDDPAQLASVLSEGALQAGEPSKRFEIAVLLSVLGGIEARLSVLGDYAVALDVISRDRQQVATFRRRDGSCIEVYYDQVVLPPDDTLGPRDRGVSHYLASGGRLRPDITVRMQRPNQRAEYTVFEIKLSDDVGYAASGYAEAIVYRHEYAEYLSGWPKAVLVTSQPTHGEPRRDDDVVAVSWTALGTSVVLDAIVERIL